jgi:SOS-response transcriptional repressor LexA
VIYHVRCHGLEEIHCVGGDYLLIRPVAPLDGDVVIVYVQSQGLMCRRIDTGKNILYALDRRKWSHELTPDDTVLGVYLGVIRKG